MTNARKNNFHVELKKLLDDYVSLVYDCTLKFPKEEIFGLTSQLRRAAMSVVLNYIEGYARRRHKSFRSFLDISYASYKESEYLIYFSHKRKYISDDNYKQLSLFGDRIGGMLWGIMAKLGLE